MNKKISLGAAISYLIVVAAVVFSITIVFSMNLFNDRISNVYEREVMYSKISEIDRVWRQNYIGSIDEDALIQTLSDGYVAGVGDRYGAYLSVESYQKYLEQLSGNGIGIGADVAVDASGYLLVTSVHTASPALIAGVMKDDLIIKIDDQDVTQETAQALAATLNENAGQEVKLTLRRGTQQIELTLVKQRMELQSVYYEMSDTTGYIRIQTFAENTAKQFETAVKSLMEVGADGIVLDVRDNAGGSLTAACQMLDLLLPEGDLVTLTYKDGTAEVFAKSGSSDVKVPLVVLVDQTTQNVAELFAKVLRDYGRASLVGNTTAGNGLYQTVVKLNDGSALMISTAYFDPPSGERFEGTGLLPDEEISLSSEGEKPYYGTETIDTQHARALEVLRAQ